MTTQTLKRAIGLLRILAAAGSEGQRLVDLQRESGLTKPTVHRILDTLKSESFVEQTETTRRYRLGNELAMLTWSSGRTVYDLKELASEEVAAVAAKTGDSCFLVIRSGHETLCIDRQTGSYPVKTFTVEVGTRRPLGIGATGIALLAALEPEQSESVQEAIGDVLANYPNSGLRQIREAVSAARRKGYAFSDGLLLKGVRGLAVAIVDAQRRPIAAIGTSAISDRITDKRIAELVRTLKMHANRIEQRIAAVENQSLFGGSRIIKTPRRGKAQPKTLSR